MCDILITGKQVADPLEKLVNYANRYSSTLLRYDLAAQGDSDALPAYLLECSSAGQPPMSSLSGCGSVSTACWSSR